MQNTIVVSNKEKIIDYENYLKLNRKVYVIQTLVNNRSFQYKFKISSLLRRINAFRFLIESTKIAIIIKENRNDSRRRLFWMMFLDNIKKLMEKNLTYNIKLKGKLFNLFKEFYINQKMLNQYLTEADNVK